MTCAQNSALCTHAHVRINQGPRKLGDMVDGKRRIQVLFEEMRPPSPSLTSLVQYFPTTDGEVAEDAGAGVQVCIKHGDEEIS